MFELLALCGCPFDFIEASIVNIVWLVCTIRCTTSNSSRRSFKNWRGVLQYCDFHWSVLQRCGQQLYARPGYGMHCGIRGSVRGKGVDSSVPRIVHCMSIIGCALSICFIELSSAILRLVVKIVIVVNTVLIGDDLIAAKPAIIDSSTEDDAFPHLLASCVLPFRHWSPPAILP